jgi:hypothetical protein
MDAVSGFGDAEIEVRLWVDMLKDITPLRSV